MAPKLSSCLLWLNLTFNQKALHTNNSSDNVDPCEFNLQACTSHKCHHFLEWMFQTKEKTVRKKRKQLGSTGNICAAVSFKVSTLALNVCTSGHVLCAKTLDVLVMHLMIKCRINQ